MLVISLVTPLAINSLFFANSFFIMVYIGDLSYFEKGSMSDSASLELTSIALGGLSTVRGLFAQGKMPLGTLRLKSLSKNEYLGSSLLP
jgi:hypothetical protein